MTDPCALQLGGSSAHVVFNRPLVPSSGSFSIAVTFLAGAITGWAAELLSQDGEVPLYLGYCGNGQYTRAGDDWENTGVPFPQDGRWHTLLLVSSQEHGEAVLYLDGVRATSRKRAIRNPSGAEFRIGRQYGAHEEYFTGRIFEVAVYERALEEAEAKSYAPGNLAGRELGLHALVQFDSSGKVADRISGTLGNAINCGVADGPTISPPVPTTPRALQLGGSSAHVVFNRPLVPSSGSFSIAVTFLAGAITGWAAELLSQDGEVPLYLGYCGNGQYTRAGDDWENTGVPFPQDGRWHTLLLVSSQEHGEAVLYLDGVRATSRKRAIRNPSGAEFRIGRQYGAHEEYFTGRIFEVAVYERALEEAEAKSYAPGNLAGRELGLHALVQFDSSGKVADRISGTLGNAINCGVADGPTIPSIQPAGPQPNVASPSAAPNPPAPSKPVLPAPPADGRPVSRRALQLNGTSDHVIFDRPLIPNAGSFSIAVSFLAAATSAGSSTLVSQPGVVPFYIGRDGTNGHVRAGGDWDDTNAIFPVDGKWHTLLLVCSHELGQALLYLDGNLLASRKGAIRNPSGAEFRIGRQPGIPGEAFDGRLFEVAIFSQALDERQVKAHLPGILDGSEVAVSALVQFDDSGWILDRVSLTAGHVIGCTFVNAPNSSANAPTAPAVPTLNVPAVQVPPVLIQPPTRRCLELSGAGDYVVFDRPLIPTTGPFSVAVTFQCAAPPMARSILLSQEGVVPFEIGCGDDQEIYAGVGLDTGGLAFPKDRGWHTLLLVHLGEPGETHLYLDGALVAQRHGSLRNPGGSEFRIGRAASGDGAFFCGRIFEVAAFSQALREEEARAYQPGTADLREVELYALVQFDEQRAARDLVSGSVGQVIGGKTAPAPPANQTPPQVFKRAVYLNGKSSHLAFEQPLIPTIGSFSVAVTFQAAADSTGAAELISQPGETPFCLGRSEDGGHIHVGAAWADTGVAFPTDGAWHTLVLVASMEKGRTLLYLDGKPVARRDGAIGNPSGTASTIGCQHGGAAAFFGGRIFEVAVFSRALRYSEVQTYAPGLLKGSEADLHALVQCDSTCSIREQVRKTVLQSTGHRFAIGPALHRPAPVARRSLRLNGTSDHAAFDRRLIPARGPFTIAVTFQRTAGGKKGGALLCQPGLWELHRAEPQILLDADLQFATSFGSEFDVSPAPADGKWHTLIYVCTDRPETAQMYLDGVKLFIPRESLIPMSSLTGTIPDGDLVIGPSFCGHIFEVAIFSRALRIAEAESYLPGRLDGSETDLDALVQFDEVCPVVDRVGELTGRLVGCDLVAPPALQPIAPPAPRVMAFLWNDPQYYLRLLGPLIPHEGSFSIAVTFKGLSNSMGYAPPAPGVLLAQEGPNPFSLGYDESFSLCVNRFALGRLPTDGEWHTVVLVIDSTAWLRRLYLDGSAMPIPMPVAVANPGGSVSYLGSGTDRADRFQGYLFEVAVFAQTLDEAQAKAYAPGKLQGTEPELFSLVRADSAPTSLERVRNLACQVCGGVAFLPEPLPGSIAVPAAPGPVVDANASSPASQPTPSTVDQEAELPHLLYPLRAADLGPSRPAIVFDTPLLPQDGTFSIAVTFRARSTMGHACLVSQFGSNVMAMRYVTPGGFYVGHSSSGFESSFPTDGKWHTVVLVFSRTTGQKTVYLDGNLFSAAHEEGGSYFGAFLIGRSPEGQSWSVHPGDFDGWIFEIAVFARALSGDEVRTYRPGMLIDGEGLYALVQFDDSQQILDVVGRRLGRLEGPGELSLGAPPPPPEPAWRPALRTDASPLPGQPPPKLQALRTAPERGQVRFSHPLLPISGSSTIAVTFALGATTAALHVLQSMGGLSLICDSQSISVCGAWSLRSDLVARDERWHTLVLVHQHDRAERLLYLDGLLLSRMRGGEQFWDTLDPSFIIEGCVFEVATFGRALSNNEAQAYLPGTLTGSEPDLAALVRFDADLPVFDRVTKRLARLVACSFVEGPTPANTCFGQPASGLPFNGRNDVLEFDVPVVPAWGDFSIAATYQTTADEWDGLPLCSQDGATPLSFEAPRGDFWFYGNDCGKVAPGRWHRVLLIVSAGRGRTWLYIDGKLRCESQAPLVNPSGQRFRVGRSVDPTRFFIGSIEELAVFARALSDAEARAYAPGKLTGSDPGLCTLIKFGGAEKRIVVQGPIKPARALGDGLSQVKLVNPATVPLRWRADAGLLFAGQGDHLVFARPFIPASGAFSISVTFRAHPGSEGPLCLVSQDGTLPFSIGRGSQGQIRAVDWEETGVPFPDDGRWHTVQLVCSAASNATYLYLDGYRAAWRRGTLRSPDGAELRIGRQAGDLQEFFTGQILEIAIFARELGEAEAEAYQPLSLDSSAHGLAALFQLNARWRPLEAVSRAAGRAFGPGLRSRWGAAEAPGSTSLASLAFNGIDEWAFLDLPVVPDSGVFTIAVTFSAKRVAAEVQACVLIAQAGEVPFSIGCSASGAVQVSELVADELPFPDDGRRHTLAVVRQEHALAIFLDGELRLVRPGRWACPDGSECVLGRELASLSHMFAGWIYEIAAFATELSDAQIQAYQPGTLTGSEPGLFALVRPTDPPTLVDLVTGRKGRAVGRSYPMEWPLPALTEVLQFAGSGDCAILDAPLIPTAGPFTLAVTFSADRLLPAGADLLSQDGDTPFYFGYNPNQSVRVGYDWPEVPVQFPADGGWHTLMLVCGSGSTKLYLDGVDVAQMPRELRHPDFCPLRIGRRADTISSSFAGRVFEVAVFTKALSFTQAVRYQPGSLHGAEPGLHALVRMRTAQPPRELVSSTWGRLASPPVPSLQSPTDAVLAMPAAARALQFLGVGDHVTFARPLVPQEGPFSAAVTFLVAPSASATVELLSQGGSVPFFIGRESQGHVRAGNDWPGTGVSFPGCDGAWHTLLVVCGQGQTSIYLDGRLQDRIPQAIRNPTGSELRLGRQFGDHEEWFAGLIAEVAIFSRALPMGEAERYRPGHLTGSEPGLCALIRAADPPTVVEQVTQTPGNLTLGTFYDLHQRVPLLPTPWLDEGMQLNGADDYVEFGRAVLPTTGSFSLAVTFLTISEYLQEWAELVSQSGTVPFFLGVNKSGHVRAGASWEDTGVAFPKDGLWHTLLLVRSDRETLLYLDRALVARGPGAIVPPSGAVFRIGRQHGNFEEYFSGRIFEVAVWNHALSPQQAWTYAAGRLDGNEPGLCALIRCDAKEARDRVSGAVGALFGDSLVPPKPVPIPTPVQALDLAGSGDFVEFEGPLVPTSGSFTLTVIYAATPMMGAATLFSQGGDVSLSLGRSSTRSPRITAGPDFPDTGVSFPTDEGWHAITLVSDVTVSYVYRDGCRLRRRRGAIRNPSAANARIGRSYGRNRDYFVGQIAEVAIFNRALATEELRTTIERRLTGTEQGLISLVRFENGTAKELIRQKAGTLFGCSAWPEPPSAATDVPQPPPETTAPLP
ncbi:MAG TPA: hypothetical protein PKI03_08770, partial [Pseudomonadota bacterium]|nr:hypothetical protein [Pseudomonadota bacterium]